VVEASALPGSDALLQLSVDLGDEGRKQIIAGIGKSYHTDGLVGRQVVVVANLKPKIIAGVKSEAMLLAVEEKEGYVLLQPDRPVKSGSRIK